MSPHDKSHSAPTPRRARARISLKMQAIGFLSRREHSRQELRAKLLDSLRKRAREEAALAAAAEKAAQALAEALREQPSNGIDDAFAPAMPATGVMADVTSARASGVRGDAGMARKRAGRARMDAAAESTALPARHVARERPALDTLTLADGAPLPPSLMASLAAGATASAAPAPAQSQSQSQSYAHTPAGPVAGRAAPASPSLTPSTRRLSEPTAFDDFSDTDATAFDPGADDLPAAPPAPLAATELELSDPEAAVDQLLDWLEAHKYLSEPRFVESRVNARARKQGALLIKLELSRHGLALEPEQAAALRETEFARAQALWQRKFGEPATDARVRARQARFLAARGFAADVVRRVVGGEEEF